MGAAHGTITGAGVVDDVNATVPVLTNMATMDVKIVIREHIG